MIESHQCAKCGESKPRSAYYRQSARPTGIQPSCKECCAKRRRDWYARNPQAALAINRRWRENNPEVAAAGRRKAELRREYGLTPEIYDGMLAEQGGVCAICKRCQSDKRLAVDHDHACCPGKRSCGRCVRGLLCDPCNRSLGWFDSKKLAILDYTRRRSS